MVGHFSLKYQYVDRLELLWFIIIHLMYMQDLIHILSVYITLSQINKPNMTRFNTNHNTDKQVNMRVYGIYIYIYHQTQISVVENTPISILLMLTFNPFHSCRPSLLNKYVFTLCKTILIY